MFFLLRRYLDLYDRFPEAAPLIGLVGSWSALLLLLHVWDKVVRLTGGGEVLFWIGILPPTIISAPVFWASLYMFLIQGNTLLKALVLRAPYDDEKVRNVSRWCRELIGLFEKSSPGK